MAETTLRPIQYRLKQAAQVMNISTQTLRQMIYRGEIEAIRLGQFIMIPVASIEKWQANAVRVVEVD